MQETEEITLWLAENRSYKNIAGMERFGINVSAAYGVPVPMLRKKAKEYGCRHEAALELWSTGIHEARILASLMADPARMSAERADGWVADFDSWDICDQCCLNLLWKLPFVPDMIERYAADGREYVRRAAFVLIAMLAVHDRAVTDERFLSWLSLVERYSADGRNFVKKAVNWALRQIGKRSMTLNAAAVESARSLAGSDSKTARWIGSDALRELTAERTQTFILNHRKK